MTKLEVVVRFDWHRVRTASGSDRIRESQLVLKILLIRSLPLAVLTQIDASQTAHKVVWALI